MSDSTGRGEVETKDFNGAHEVDYGIHVAVSIVMYVSPRILYKNLWQLGMQSFCPHHCMYNQHGPP